MHWLIRLINDVYDEDGISYIQAESNGLPGINEKISVELCSRTPFGDLQSLAHANREYIDINAFRRESDNNLKTSLSALADKWGRSELHSLNLLRRLESADEAGRMNYPATSFGEYAPERFNLGDILFTKGHLCMEDCSRGNSNISNHEDSGRQRRCNSINLMIAERIRQIEAVMASEFSTIVVISIFFIL